MLLYNHLLGTRSHLGQQDQNKMSVFFPASYQLAVLNAASCVGAHSHGVLLGAANML